MATPGIVIPACEGLQKIMPAFAFLRLTIGPRASYFGGWRSSKAFESIV
jgi:hypothetical protein